MKRSQLIKGYLYAISSAVIYGCMPLMASYIYADGVNPLTLVFLRNALALPSLAVLAWMQHKTLAIPRKALPSIGLLSLLGCCVTPILLFSSYQYMASGTATVFHFIYPTAVVVGGMLFLRNRIRVGNLVSVVLCAVGICLFYTPGAPLDWRGSVLALSSGITFAAYVLLLPAFRYRETVSGFLFSFYVAAASSVFTLLICLVTGQLALPTSLGGWGLCVLFALAVTTGAVVLFQQGAFLIGGERTTILSTLEPITGVLVGVLVFHEPLGPKIIVGSLLVISASVLIAVLDLRRQAPS